jgi:hypothetical protein
MSNLCLVSVESVSAVADELGIDAEDVLPMVSSQVEYRLRQLIQDMTRYMVP